MDRFFKKTALFLILFLMVVIPAMAVDDFSTNAIMNTPFKTDAVPKEIAFVIHDEINLADGTIIPLNSLIKADVYQYQKEKRWHKAGFFICIPTAYYDVDNKKSIKISSEQEIYVIAKKTEKFDKKDAAITTTELVLSTGSSIFIPGVDVLYFFTKGAIQREKNKNWFKSGVSNAYENSLCWIWIKGKPIELETGDCVNIKEIQKEKAEKLSDKIDKKRSKEEAQKEKRLLKQQQKKFQKEEKHYKKEQKQQQKEQQKQKQKKTKN